MSDNEIRIDIGIDTEEFQKGLDELPAMMQRTMNKLAQAIYNVDTTKGIDRISASIEDMLAKSQGAIEKARNKWAALDAIYDQTVQKNGARSNQAVAALSKVYAAEDNLDAVIKRETQSQAELNMLKDAAAVKSAEIAKSEKNLGSIIKEAMSKAIKTVGKFTLSIFGLRSAFTLFRKLINGYLSDNQDVSQKISNIWAALGAYLGPVIDYIVNIVYKALAYINAFVKALTGIDFIANRNAKALKKQASATAAAAKASKSMAGFDEMNTLSSSSTSAGATSTGTAIALPSLNEEELAGIQKFSDLVKTLADNWGLIAGIIAGVIVLVNGINAAWSAGILTGQLVGILGGASIIIAGIVVLIQGIIDCIKDPSIQNIGTVLEGLTIILLGILVILAAIGIPMTALSIKILAIIAVVLLVATVVTKCWSQIKALIDKAVKWISGIFNSIVSFIKSLINGVIKGINWCIDQLNKIQFKIPDWVKYVGLGNIAGKTIGFNIKRLNYLAQGGIVTRPTQAIIGEAGKEAVLPLENNTEWMDALADKINGGTTVVYVQLDGKTITKQVISRQKQLNMQTNGGV